MLLPRSFYKRQSKKFRSTTNSFNSSNKSIKEDLTHKSKKVGISPSPNVSCLFFLFLQTIYEWSDAMFFIARSYVEGSDVQSLLKKSSEVMLKK